MVQRALLLTLAATFASGCGGTYVYLRSGEKLNNQVPVRVKIYRLKVNEGLWYDNADFASAWNGNIKDEQGNNVALSLLDSFDVLASRTPEAAKKTIEKKYTDEQVMPETHYFGVVALFTPPDNVDVKDKRASWKQKVLKEKSNDFIFVLDEFEMKMLKD